jgi:polysaccharide export outer membrane protein
MKRRLGLLLRLFVVGMTPLMLLNCTNNVGQNTASLSAADQPGGAPTMSAADQPGGAVTIGAADQPGSGQTTTEETSTTALASADARGGDYRISPYDAVQISVFQVQDLNKTVEVAADGNITLPLIGKVPVAGKTTQEAEANIAERLRKKYLQSPQVSVVVAKFGQRVTVSGAVKSPQVLPVDSQLTLTEAVARAGGLGDTANSNRVHIARRTGDTVHDAVYNLDAIQAGTAPDPTMRGGDIVVAEQSGVKVAFSSVKDLLPFAILATLF